MKALFIFLFTMPAITPITAQQVIASSGNTATAGSYRVDWTLGEPVIETFTGSNYILTQGMHQTNLVVTQMTFSISPGEEEAWYYKVQRPMKTSS